MRGIKLCSVFFLVNFGWAFDGPYTYGPHLVKHKTFNGIFNAELDHNLGVWAPDDPGSYPVIYFVSGLAGLIPPALYSLMLSQIASHGFLVLTPFDYIALPQNQYDPKWIIEIDAWAQENLLHRLQEDGFELTGINFANTLAVGHSSGNHVIVNYLKSGCYNIKGAVLLSPVDGVDPFGFIDDYCITPGEKLSFETPTLLISVGLDGLPGIDAGGLFPPCAPDDLSNLRFWNALNGPAWLNNATLFGHTDILDPGAISEIAGLFRVCAQNDEGIDAVIISFTAGQIVSFFQALLGECEMMKYLVNTALMPTEVETLSQGDVLCPSGYCKSLLS